MGGSRPAAPARPDCEAPREAAPIPDRAAVPGGVAHARPRPRPQVIFIFFSIGVIMIPIGVVCLHYGLLVRRRRARAAARRRPAGRPARHGCSSSRPPPSAAQAKEQVVRYDQTCFPATAGIVSGRSSNADREKYLFGQVSRRARRAGAASLPRPASRPRRPSSPPAPAQPGRSLTALLPRTGGPGRRRKEDLHH
jgi:hypothetical protein